MPIPSVLDGVLPLRAQVRRLSGCSIKPRSIDEGNDSFTLGSLFYPRPLGLVPLFDSRFVSLTGSPLRLLAWPAELVQDPRDVVGMIADAEPLLNQLGHPRAGPEIGVETSFLRAREQYPLQSLQVLDPRSSGLRQTSGPQPAAEPQTPPHFLLVSRSQYGPN